MFKGLFQPIHLLVIFGIALLVFGPLQPATLAAARAETVLRGETRTGAPRRVAQNYGVLINFSTFPPLQAGSPRV
jgi:hypothetical protein